MIIHKDFKEFVESLNATKVRYLVVGGYAVVYHGHIRSTGDFDLWVEPTEINLGNLVQALKDFGFESLKLSVEDFMDPDGIVQLGYPPNRIDILTDLPDVVFKDCYLLREMAEFDGFVVNFIDLVNLKRTKQATGRHQDLADVENLDGGRC